MVSVGVSRIGKTSVVFVAPGAMIKVIIIATAFKQTPVFTQKIIIFNQNTTTDTIFNGGIAHTILPPKIVTAQLQMFITFDPLSEMF